MKHLCESLIILFLVMFFACGGDGGGSDTPAQPGVKTFSGTIEKGALQQGATITASEWSVSGGYSGNVYSTETINNLGDYTISSSELQGILDVRADGFFINENTGTVEDTRIILSGFVDSSVSGQGNINIITHIIKQRVINLMTAGTDFSTANNQAVAELYATLNWTPENPLNTSISENAKLLFLSSAICKNRTVSEVSNLLTSLVADMADGNIDISVLDSSFSLIETDAVVNNITALYGSSPEIASVKVQVIDYRNIVDETIRQITMIPISASPFYLYKNGALRGFTDSQIQSFNISYVQRYLGETTTVNCIINDFFSVVNEGVKTLYFQVTFPYDNSVKMYSQTDGVITEVTEFPDKPIKSSILFENDDYKLAIINGDTTQVTSKNSGTEITRNKEWVTGYYEAGSLTYNGESRGAGIFTTWSSGIVTWLSCDIESSFIQFSFQGEMW